VASLRHAVRFYRLRCSIFWLVSSSFGGYVVPFKRVARVESWANTLRRFSNP
jgi:hypothetical protein